jgi:ectoine hydroxylase-related dioxygenase (phytanoyl-CoA dioxygenase family)
VFPKLRPPFGDPAVLAHPIVLEILRRVLGEDLRCAFVSSDCVMPGARLQSPHRELGAAGPGAARAVVVNVPLVRCGPDDGPIEVWPVGSHRWPASVLADLGLDDDAQDDANPAMEAFAARLSSTRLLVEPGDVVLRDAGLLHRGTPNSGTGPRSFLTVAYLRAGHTHDYATSVHNVGPGLIDELDPAVRCLIDPPQRARPVTA